MHGTFIEAGITIQCLMANSRAYRGILQKAGHTSGAVNSGHYVIKQTFSIGSTSASISTTFSHRMLVTNGSILVIF
jgi:hypothetical protein